MGKVSDVMVGSGVFRYHHATGEVFDVHGNSAKAEHAEMVKEAVNPRRVRVNDFVVRVTLTDNEMRAGGRHLGDVKRSYLLFDPVAGKWPTKEEWAALKKMWSKDDAGN